MSVTNINCGTHFVVPCAYSTHQMDHYPRKAPLNALVKRGSDYKMAKGMEICSETRAVSSYGSRVNHSRDQFQR